MRSERRLLLVVSAIVACSASDSHVGCSPTLTCSLHDASFAPPEKPDAGPLPCDPSSPERRCRAVSIATGGAHSCGIAKAGELYCWGSDSEGQLGAQSEADQSDAGVLDSGPVLEEAKQVTAGGAHTCVLQKDGSLSCFGRDAEGQVSGVASPDDVTVPMSIAIDHVSQVSAGNAHTCAVVESGVVCWGSAAFGQVGREVSDAALAPDLVPGTGGAVEVAAGYHHSCARLKDGRVVCWGELIDASSGELQPTADAVEVDGLRDATALTAGAGHSCALRAHGGVACWGLNGSGQLGDGSRNSSAMPVMVAGIAPSVAIASGGGALDDGTLVGHSCAVDNNFLVQCWGRNAEGQLGIGHADDSPTPVTVLGRPGESDEPYLNSMVDVRAGGFHTCALDFDGPVVCWGAGDNNSNQLGARRNRTVEFGRVVRVARFSRFD